MNKIELIGRIAREPQIYRNDEGDITTVRYTLAVDRRYHRDEEKKQQTADFISCVVFGKGAEFADNYLCKGIKLAIVGRLQSGSYTTEEGQTVYTTDVAVEEQDFVESKSTNQELMAKAGKKLNDNDIDNKSSVSSDLNAFFTDDFVKKSKPKTGPTIK